MYQVFIKKYYLENMPSTDFIYSNVLNETNSFRYLKFNLTFEREKKTHINLKYHLQVCIYFPIFLHIVLQGHLNV